MEISSSDSHNVFIDFSTKDTRYSFVSHLSAAFRRRSISTFLGDGDATPEADFRLPDDIKSAVERTSVFVVVFSDNYAFSPLCLETLVTFLDRRKDGLVVVIPVFYGDVTPSIVKQQTERFGKAFSDHRSSFSDDRMKRWENGLIEAAELHGYESNDKRK